MSRMYAVLMVAAAVLLVGARYKPPSEGSDAATLIFKRGYTPGLTAGGGQTYAISPTACRGWTKVASFSVLASKEPKSIRAPAAAPLYVFVNGVVVRSSVDLSMPSGVSTPQQLCSTAARFVPEAGRTYEIVQDAAACLLAVTDTTSGAAPASLEMLEPKTCAPKAKDQPA